MRRQAALALGVLAIAGAAWGQQSVAAQQPPAKMVSFEFFERIT